MLEAWPFRTTNALDSVKKAGLAGEVAQVSFQAVPYL